MRRGATRILLALTCAGGVAAAVMLGLGSGSAAASGNGPAGVPSFGHVFVIVGENKEITLINKSNAPYITNKLKPSSAWLTNYYALTHFSEPNYVCMASGQ